jgi:hypothetical protein
VQVNAPGVSSGEDNIPITSDKHDERVNSNTELYR